MADYVVTEWDDEGNPVDGYFDEDYSNEGGNIEAVGEDDENYSHEGAHYPGISGLQSDENQSDAETNRLIGMAQNPSEYGLGNISPGSDIEGPSMLAQIASALGVKKPNGDYDWEKILGLAGTAIGTVGAMTQTPQRQATMEELMAMMPKSNTAPMWTEAELAFGRRPMQTGTDLQRIYAADMPSPVTPGKNYADGGEIEGDMEGALASAFAGGVRGADGGQSDLININVSPGEYVFDAESVSALGDGNTEAGIAKLDELREQLRAQKRSAPLGEIPPPAQGPLSYIQGA